MIDDLDGLDRATGEFRRFLDGVSAEHLALSTPCPECPLGVIGARWFLSFRIFDCTLHAWDLATAIGADATLDPDLVDAVLQIVRAEPAGMGFGVEATAAMGGSVQQQLLALSGRA